MRIWIVASVLFFSAMNSAQAAPRELKDLDACDILLSGSSEQVARLFFHNWSKNWQDAIGMRGYFGNSVPNTPANVELAMEYGLMWWGVKWNFAATLEEAIAHRLQARALHEAKGTPYTDVIVAGIYILGSESELGVEIPDGEIQVPVPPETIQKIFARGAYEIDHLGNATFIEPERLLRRASLATNTYNKVGHLPGNFGKNSLSQSGWVGLKMHGIHDYSAWKDSKEATKLRKLARQLADRGYTIRFNQDFEAMLDKIKNQTRSYRESTVGEDGTLVKGDRKEMDLKTSRYSHQDVYDSMLAILKAGKGYSVGVYNGRGELVAGEIGVRNGNHYYGDSVFYDEVEHAKIAALALFDVLAAAGMPYSDPGMITPYTASMGAELIPFPEYVAKMKSGPAARIDLPASWDPRGDGDLDSALAEVVKRKSQGLGNVKFTRRTPVIADPQTAAAAAARAGLVRTHLNLAFVNTPEEAAAHAATVSSWEEMPVYIQGAAIRGVFRNWIEYLRATLVDRNDDGVKAYFISNAKHPEHRREIPLKQLVEVLDLKVESDPPELIEGDAFVLKVRGWGFPAAAK